MKQILEFKNRHGRLFYYLCYSALFLCMSLLVFSWFIVNGKSFIYKGDGMEQHVNALDYYGEYLREIVKTLLYEYKLVIPMFDMNIGYGSDIITTLHYYVIGDPLCLFSVIVPGTKTEALYTVLILLRLFLSGISFSLYSFYHKNGRFPTLAGSLCYCFCGYSLYAGVRHPYFVNPMIYLPLLLIGIDKIFKKERPYLFILMTAVSAMSNFYFFYMLCIFMFIYAVFRYIVTFKKVIVKELAGWFFKFAGYFFTGAAIACVILLPVIWLALSTKRMTAENYIPILYEARYYGSMLTKGLAGSSGYWSVMGYSPVMLLAVFVLFSKRKKYMDLKIGFLLLTLFLCVPYIGHIINVLSYVSNRWIWAYSMLNAYILVKMLPQMLCLTAAEKKRVVLFIFFYVICCLFVRSARTDIGYGSVIILMLIGGFLMIADGERMSAHKIQAVFLLGVCIGIEWIAFGMYSISERNYLNSFHNKGHWERVMYHHTPSKLIHSMKDKTVYRYDQLGAIDIYNTAMQQKLNSTSFYFSLANGVISEYFEELYLNSTLEQRYNNLDGRTMLDALAAVKYFVVNKGEEQYLPYNYRENNVNPPEGGKAFQLYEGSNILPLGYTYDSYIKAQEYQAMSVPQKQQALLQGCVLSESSFPEEKPLFDDVERIYEIVPGDGALITDDGSIKISKPNAVVTLNFQGVSDSETYVIFDNLQVEGIHPNSLYTEAEWAALSVYEQNKRILSNKYWQPKNSYKILLKTGNITRAVYTRTNRNSFYSGRHNYLCNLGYSEEAKESIMIQFPDVGIYSCDDLKVVCQPVKNINGYINERKEDILDDLKLSVNTIEGNIALEEPKILLLSVPYSRGFRVFVDGKEEKLLQANTMFLAVELAEGNHHVKFSYETPLIRCGLFISMTGIAVFALIVFVREGRKKNKLCH